MVTIYHNLLIYSTIDKLCVVSNLFPIINNATVNIFVHFVWSIQIFISAGFIPRVKVGGSLGMHIFNFGRYCQTAFKVVEPIHIVDALHWKTTRNTPIVKQN